MCCLPVSPHLIAGPPAALVGVNSKEACAAQLTPASLRIEIAKAKCEQQVHMSVEVVDRLTAPPRVQRIRVALQMMFASCCTPAAS